MSRRRASHASQRTLRAPKELEKQEESEEEEEDLYEDPLVWSFQYVAVCILLPLGNEYGENLRKS